MQDLIIIGAGAGGMSASLFASRYGLTHKIFGQSKGGQILDASNIENYLGFTSITGPELAAIFVEHVESYGVKIDPRRVVLISKMTEGFEVVLDDGQKESSRSVLLTMGAKHRALNVPGEDRFLGCGVSYSPSSDQENVQNQVVAVVGGGDSACTGALALSKTAKKVYLIVRRDELKAEPTWVEQVEKQANVEILFKNNVLEVGGKDSVEWIQLAEPLDGEERLPVAALFITIGQIPAVDLVREVGVVLDKEGYILVGPSLETNVAGVFAAGDIALQPGGLVFRQITTSVGEGARAVSSIYQYLKQKSPAPNWG